MGFHLKSFKNKKIQQPIRYIAIVFLVILLIVITLNNNEKTNTPVTSTEQGSLVTNNKNSLLSTQPEKQENSQLSLQNLPANNIDALDLSVDDLSGKDDEVDEIPVDNSDDVALTDEAQSALDKLLDATSQAIKIKEQFSHTVEKGDTFSTILEQSGLEKGISNQLTKDFPELANLKPGQQFYWILNDKGQLSYLNWLKSRKEEYIYELNKDNKFVRQILKKQSTWKKEILTGKIETSFARSLHDLHLSNSQISQLTNALQWQINMSRLQKGDQVKISIAREYIDGKLTGQGNIDGIHMRSKGKDYYSIQADNGRYYDENGQTLGKGFRRYPLLHQARVSSPFNLHRRHPITHRVRPHKGVDFAVKRGTPVIAPADGTVIKVAYQARGAGRYIVIRHNQKYQTIYMHLSRSLVKAGQKVKQGQRIALSGNTGRSTGPHLHYEFHINNRPVNPLTVKLPRADNVMSTAERKRFSAKVKEMKKKLVLSN